MKWAEKLRHRFKGLTGSIARYPLTAAFLVAAAVLIAIEINTDKDYSKILLTCAVGAVLGATLQAVYERFFEKVSARLILMGGCIVLTAGYDLIIRSAPKLSMEIGVRTSVALFALLIAFIWAPVIRSRISFNDSFMVVFKSLFHSVFYSAVIMGGCSAIIAAIHQLIYPLDSRFYSHTANIIFVLFAPVFFLSLIPLYPGKKEKEADRDGARDEAIGSAAHCPRFLEVLISYIIIPLTAVFTVILLIYIVINIRGRFWTNNLLEPMLVSYAVTVVLVYILASGLENKFAVLFRKIFPKVLIPIVLFQIASSVLSLSGTGITHTRYYVILFGIFAASAGVVMSLVPVRKNGIIAAMLIAFSIVSIIPPVDAFTVSRVNQTNMLKTALTQNGMLKNNSITPNGSISADAKKKIIKSVEYLSMMGYTDRIPWLPAGFVVYEDFNSTFGFDEYDLPETTGRPINVVIDSSVPLDIAGYDFLAHTYINQPDDNTQPKICDFARSGVNYSLIKEKVSDRYDIVLTGANNLELIRFDTGEIFSRYKSFTAQKSGITLEEATFTAENDSAKLTFVVQNANMDTGTGQTYYNADLYILVSLK